MTIAERWANVNEKYKIMANIEKWISEKYEGIYRVHTSNFSLYVQDFYDRESTAIRLSDHSANNFGTSGTTPRNYLWVSDFKDLRELKKAIKLILDKDMETDEDEETEIETEEERERRHKELEAYLEGLRKAKAEGKELIWHK